MNKYKLSQYDWGIYPTVIAGEYWVIASKTPATDSLSLYIEQLDLVRWLVKELSYEMRDEPVTWDMVNLKEKLYKIVTTEI